MSTQTKSLEIIGRVIKTLPKQTGTGIKGAWERQDFLIESEDKYPKQILFGAFGSDKTEIVDKLQNGDLVKVKFNLETRENNERYYTQANAWAIEKILPETKEPPKLSEEDFKELPF